MLNMLAIRLEEHSREGSLATLGACRVAELSLSGISGSLLLLVHHLLLAKTGVVKGG